MPKKIIFLDRDGTLIDEPYDQQIDSIAKLKLKKNVIPALLKLKQAGFIFVMVTNQDGLGTDSFKQEDFEQPQSLFLDILNTQDIEFDAIRICPHKESDGCDCRKPKVGLVLDYLKDGKIDFNQSYVIGDRVTDLQLANCLGIQGILYNETKDWLEIADQIIMSPRCSQVDRKTKETEIYVAINLDQNKKISIKTGIGFFDHMLEQLAKHGGFDLALEVKGDLNVDEHHTVEDTGLALGDALRKALGDKLGIHRYGFLLPMDEASAQVAIDLSGRSFFVFEGNFTREKIGDLPTELIPHFFRSFAESLKASIQIKVLGENNHHMIESIFKGVGRSLRQAINKEGYDLPTTKGVL